jgi:Zn-dependent membrane protease YugP
MSKKEANLWLRRIYYALDKQDLDIRFHRDMIDPRGQIAATHFGIKGVITGLYDPNTKTIALNPSRRRYGGIVKVMIHELLHHIRRDWNEKKVEMYENLIYEALSDRQLWNLMKKIFTLH